MRKIAGSISDIQQEFHGSASRLTRPIRKPSPRITLRLTEEENTKLRQLSEGMTVSAYIRQRLFDDNVARRRRRSHAPVKDQTAMAQLLGLLGDSRIANNLNQLAFHANTGTLLIDDQTTNQINEAYVHVLTMRAELVKALGLSGEGAL